MTALTINASSEGSRNQGSIPQNINVPGELSRSGPTDEVTMTEVAIDASTEGISNQATISEPIALPGGLSRHVKGENGPDMNFPGPDPMLLAADPAQQTTAVAWFDTSGSCRVGVLNDGDSAFAWASKVGTGKCMGLHVRDNGVVAVVVTSAMNSKQDPTLTLVLYSQTGQEKGKAKVPCLSNKDGAPHGQWGCTYYPGGILQYSKKQNLYGVYWGTGCRQSQWCKGHQGGCQSYVDAATMKTKWNEGNPWICSHDMHQAYGVNPTTGAFIGACGGDAYPKGIKISVKASRGQFQASNTITKHWGNMGGKMAARYGQFAANGNGFLLAWSSTGNAPREQPHELMVAGIDQSGKALSGFPKKLSQDSIDKYDVTMIPYSSGYLVGYIEGKPNKAQWWKPMGILGTKFLKLDTQGNKAGAP